MKKAPRFWGGARKVEVDLKSCHERRRAASGWCAPLCRCRLPSAAGLDICAPLAQDRRRGAASSVSSNRRRGRFHEVQLPVSLLASVAIAAILDAAFASRTQSPLPSPQRPKRSAPMQ